MASPRPLGRDANKRAILWGIGCWLFASSAHAHDDPAPTPELSTSRPAPYRRGLELTAALGAGQCLGITGRGCIPSSRADFRPMVMFDFGLGYRIGRFVSVGGMMAFGSRLTGFDDPELVRQRRRDIVGYAVGWFPLQRIDLGLGLAVGRREHTLFFDADADVGSLAYTGWSWRPALHYRHWVLADYAVGAKLVALIDGNATICVAARDGGRQCATDLTPVPDDYRQTVSHGLMLAIEVAGVATLY